LRILLNGTQAQNEEFVFNPKIFRTLLLGGVCEFFGGTLMLFSFRSALLANINQGICCSAMLSMTCVTVTTGSYFLYKERVHRTQLIGIILILIAISLIVVYEPAS